MTEELKSGIYCIENIVNGKKYIGWAKNIKKRLENHFSPLKHNKHKNDYLQKSYNKYGKENFISYIIEEFPPQRELLCLMEIYFIAYYNSYWEDGGGYNMTRGGDGGIGYTHTDEWKKEASERMIVNWDKYYEREKSEETLFRLRKPHPSMQRENHPNFGKHPSDETRKKQSLSHMGKIPSEETKRKQKETLLKNGNPNIGIKYPNSTSKYHFVWKVTYHNKKYGDYVYWASGIGRGNKNIGLFKTELDAAIAYNDYIIKNNINLPLNILPS
jgi:group I intron endonuclease